MAKRNQPFIIPLLIAVMTFASVLPVSVEPAFAQSAAKSSGKAKSKAGGAAMAGAGAGSEALLPLDSYLDQVRERNQSYVSSKMTVEGAELRAEEWKLLTTTALTASSNYVVDKRETGSTLQGNENRAQTFSVGLRKQTDFGLQGSLTYNFNNYSVFGVPPQFLPQPEYYTTGPVLELSHSLWRNGFGREIQATENLQASQVLALKFNESFRQTAIIAEAESVYWRLALAREAVKATRENLERAERLKQWSSRRARMELSDRSDLLQFDTSALNRSLELQSALDEVKAAARAFNTMRGTQSEIVGEQLVPINTKIIADLQLPERVTLRNDVLAAEQRMRVAKANSQLGIEKNKPKLDVVGSIGLNGRDASAGEAISEGYGAGHPNYTIGVRFDMPLDLSLLKRDREGYQREAVAADVAYQRTVFEQERYWTDLTAQFSENIERLKLAEKIEKAQREKLDYERNRHTRGRTTTFQVVQFEQEFANAQLARIRAQAAVLNLYAQLKTFGGGQ